MPVFVGAGTSSFMKGSDGVGVSTMTTTQRNALSGVKKGQFIFNETLNLAQYYDGTAWKSIDSPPVITGVAIDGRASASTGYVNRNSGGTSTLIIAGSLFDIIGAVVTFKGTAGGEGTVNTQSINRNNSSQLTVTVTSSDFLEADDPYDVVVTNGSGLAGKLSSAIDVNVPPTFATSTDTNIGNVKNGDTSTQFDANLTTVAATDADSDSITHTISAGSLPNGMTIQADGTFTGTASGLPSSATVYTFTVQAATAKGNATRQFKMTAKDNYHVAASGGTVTTSGDYKIHTFLADGSFTVSDVGHPAGSTTVEYLVVAGGGGGGRGANAGAAGAGAGGLRTNFPSPATGGFAVSATGYPITVGDGGAGTSSPSTSGGSGSSSIFSSITSAGGGGGGGYQQDGISGGSGGGAGSQNNPPGGTGNTPPVSPSQGNNGGPGGPGGPEYCGGGGGGHSQAGETGRGPGPGTYGGAGTQVNIDGNNYYWAGGGGGPSWNNPSPGGNGGIGGGGGGHTPNPTSGSGTGGGSAINPGQAGGPGDGGSGGTNLGDGGANSGGGGGGGTHNASGATGQGGKGIVILRYKYQ